MTRRSNDPGDEGDEEGGEGEPFDALSAAEELEASLAEASGRGEGGAGADAYVELLEGEIAALQQELEQARERVARTEAEVPRAVERIAREAERERQREHREGLRLFLDVLDDFDRAIASAREERDARGTMSQVVLTGMELVHRRFVAALGELGVQHLSALGERFDPALHEAVSAVPVAEPERDGVVVGVAAEGYTLGGEVLRPARVAVGRA